MRVRSAIKLQCKFCYYTRSGASRYVRCKANPRHKQRQGFHTLINIENNIENSVSELSGLTFDLKKLSLNPITSTGDIGIIDVNPVESNENSGNKYSNDSNPFKYDTKLGISQIYWNFK